MKIERKYMYRPIPGFDLYEINQEKIIRHVKTLAVKAPHRGGSNIRLYCKGKEVSRKIDKLFDLAFPELVEGVEVVNYSKYKIRKNGDVYSKYEAKVVVPIVTKKGYRQVSLTGDDGSTANLLVHRLVALAYLDKIDGFEELQINHIDGDKGNNCASNLEWCTGAENLGHAVATGLYVTKQRKCKVSYDGINWQEFLSFVDAAKSLNTTPAVLRNTAVKNAKHEFNRGTSVEVNPFRYKGIIVKYVDEASITTYNKHKN